MKKFRGHSVRGLVTGWKLIAEEEGLCSDVGDQVERSRVRTRLSSLQMLNHPDRLRRTPGRALPKFSAASCSLGGGGTESKEWGDCWGTAPSLCVAEVTVLSSG